MIQLKQIALGIIEQSTEYLNQISKEAYQSKIPNLLDATIGQHTRHFIEFFQCLMDQIERNVPIDYSKRKRNTNIESDPKYAMSCLDLVKTQIQNLDVEQDCVMECAKYYSIGEALLVPSSIARELVFNIDHAILHLAMVKMGIKAIAPEIQLSEEFGYAPSTVSYLKHSV